MKRLSGCTPEEVSLFSPPVAAALFLPVPEGGKGASLSPRRMQFSVYLKIFAYLCIVFIALYRNGKLHCISA